MNKPPAKNVFGSLPIKVDVPPAKSIPPEDAQRVQRELQTFPVTPADTGTPTRSPVHSPERIVGTSPNTRRLKANSKSPESVLEYSTLGKNVVRLSDDWTELEPVWKRRTYATLALIIAGAFMFFLNSFWAPAPGRPGIDENGYLVGGRNFAQSGTIGFKPADNFEFVGSMWVRTKEEVKPLFPVPLHLHIGKWNIGTFDLDKKFPSLRSHTKEGWYYPKYPLGVSVLDAAAIKIGDSSMTDSVMSTLSQIKIARKLFGINASEGRGRRWTFLVSPISVALAVLGMFFLTRIVAGSFYGLMAMIVLATGYTTLELATIPSSHAPALVMVVWGMFFLLRWSQTGKWWRGMLAGLLLGYAVTIRYTEALLLFPLYPLDQVLRDTAVKNYPIAWTIIRCIRLLPIGPLGIAVICSIRWTRIKSYFLAAIPIVSWGLVVGGLVSYNWFAMGSATGYDSTNESLGFSTKEFLSKWDFSIQQIYSYAMFLTLPLGLMGIGLMFKKSGRLGSMFLLWFLPGTLLYNAYYWGQNIQGVGFLRFFLTLLPPLIVGCMWLLNTASMRVKINPDGTAFYRPGSIAGPIAAGLLTLAVGAMGLHITLLDLTRQHRGNINLYTTADRILINSNKAIRDAQKSVNLNRDLVISQPYNVLANHVIDQLKLIAGESSKTTNSRRTFTENLRDYSVALSEIGPDKNSSSASSVMQPKPAPRITPVVFMDGGIFPQHLQYMQFMCDGTWYTLDAFTPRMAGGFGLFGFGQAVKKPKNNKTDDSQDAGAVLIQQARIDYMTEFLKDKTPADLLNLQKTTINNALAAERPVFAVLASAMEIKEFKKNFNSGDYIMIEMEQWVERCSIPKAEEDVFGDAQTRRKRNAMSPPQWMGEPFISWQPKEYTMFEVRRKPSLALRSLRSLYAAIP